MIKCQNRDFRSMNSVQHEIIEEARDQVGLIGVVTTLRIVHTLTPGVMKKERITAAHPWDRGPIAAIKHRNMILKAWIKRTQETAKLGDHPTLRVEHRKLDPIVDEAFKK